MKEIKGVELVEKTDAIFRTETVYIWKCLACGNVFKAIRTQVHNKAKRGGISHCGCLTKSRRQSMNKGRIPANKLDDLSASVNLVYRVSTKRGRTLTKEDVRNLIQQPCHYCGVLPNHYRVLNCGQWSRTSTVPTHGIDRKDSALGYTKENCVPCCSTCNYLKRDMEYTIFLKLIKTIYENRWVGV